MSSLIHRHRPKFLMGGVVTGCLAVGALMIFPYAKFPNVPSTPGTQNIENRWSAGGGAKSHTPALGTRRGDAEDVKAKGTKVGLDRGGKEWEERIGDQVSKVWIP